MAIDFADLMLPVAERLLGPPNEKRSNNEEKRWGTKGSLAVNIKKGVWTDFENNESGGCLDFVRREINGGDPIAWLRDNHFIQDTEIVATFDYVDEKNVLLYQTCRKADGGFWQRRPDGHGWIYNLKKVRRVLYRLPELIASTDDQVYLTEGEKHADRLRQLGLCATTNVGGAGKWRNEYSEFLRGKDCVILTDNDEPGFKHGEKVARSLAGIAKRVRVLLLQSQTQRRRY